MKKMKKLTALLLTMVLITTGIVVTTPVFAETNDVVVTLDGEAITFPDAQPFINEDNRTLVPVRFVSEAMEAELSWEAQTSTVTIVKGENTIVYPIGSLEATLNGTAVAFDTKSLIKDSRTFVPIAFISELLNCSVTWSQETRTVAITTNSEASANTSTVNAFDLESGTVTLNNGLEMPVLGLGTYRLTDEETENSVYHALTSGYKLIDTAAAYGNEEAVGRGIKKSGVAREDVFITTKLWPNDYANAAAAIDAALERLDVEYIDLLLLHQPWEDYIGAYQAMEVAVGEGKVRSIGVSNFYQNSFDAIMDIATIPPAVLQNERNPYFQQADMMDHIAPYGTIMMDWFPLGGRGDNVVPSERQQSLFDNETILEIAQAHDRSAVQVILRWHVQSGGIAIPGSRNPDHILENITIFDFELTEEEMQKLATLKTDIPAFDFREVDEQPDFDSFTPPADTNNQE